ncbi:hypothetical protein JRI60_48980 [Archangium violaceum]|uniref:hypothetical protein n=1 Tax=Archangium violaceum TaxID=83451 RepID=UPI0019509208|nr:hypothetical protein [Archangium violaceum]QRN96833.1 hypothetical protein JRI60_48980 [Archangium violaceum]
MSLGQHDHGDRRKDPSEEALRQLEELRRKDRQEFQQLKQEGNKFTAAQQKTAQAVPQRHSYESPLKAGEAQRSREVTAPKGSTPAAPVRSPSPPRVDARLVLGTGKPAGTYLREHPPAPQGASAGDSALMGAVAEAHQLLANVKGIERIGTGVNKAGEHVVVIVPKHGFSMESLRAVPEKVQGINTVVAIPFDLLPLRRTTAPESGLPSGFVVSKSNPSRYK